MKKNILLFLATLLAIFIVSELIFRLAWVNKEWWVDEKRGAVYVEPLNRYGPGRFDEVRDFKYEKKKPKGTIRIIAVGDSFTWGDGVKFDDTYAKRLERRLNYFVTPKTGKKYEVMNMSWCGFSTFQQINELELIKGYQPDIIVWGYCLNDTEDWADPVGVQTLRYWLIYKREPKKILKYIYRNSYSISFIAERLTNLRIGFGNKKYYKHLYDDSYMGWIRVQKSFEIMREQKIPIVVLIFPLVSYKLDERYPFSGIHQKIKKELEKNSLSYIDFYDVKEFKDEDPIRMQAVPYKNSHPSEIAHRIIEEVVFQKLTNDYKNIIEIEKTSSESQKK